MIYSYTLTDSNKAIATNKLEACEMVPCYLHGGDPRTPFAIIKVVMDRNPFTY
jgi:hypothetical protein